MADVLLAALKTCEAIDHARLVLALRGSSLLRPAEIRGEPIEQVAERAERRAERCRRAARAPRSTSKRPVIRARLAELRAQGMDERFICGKVARKVGVTSAYVRRVRDEEKRNKANAQLRAPVGT